MKENGKYRYFHYSVFVCSFYVLFETKSNCIFPVVLFVLVVYSSAEALGGLDGPLSWPADQAGAQELPNGLGDDNRRRQVSETHIRGSPPWSTFGDHFWTKIEISNFGKS